MCRSWFTTTAGDGHCTSAPVTGPSELREILQVIGSEPSYWIRSCFRLRIRSVTSS